MNTTNTSPNGARAKILRALITHGMLPTNELAEKTGLHPDQARDNAIVARKDGLLTSVRDDVTRLVAYKITAKGREYCNGAAASLPKQSPVEAPSKDPVSQDVVTLFAPPGGKGVIDAVPAKCQDCDSTTLALDLAQKAMARLRDEKISLLTERDDARKEADLLRESSEQMNRAIYHLQSAIDERDAVAKESDAAINERLSKYDALVGEKHKLAVDVTNLQADNEKLRRQVLAIESSAPAPEITEYAVRHDNGPLHTAGRTRAEAVKRATEDAKDHAKLVGVYGLTLIGVVEIRPVFVASES